MLDKKGSRRFEHSLIKKIRSWVLGYWWTQLIDASRKLGDTYTGDGSSCGFPVGQHSPFAFGGTRFWELEVGHVILEGIAGAETLGPFGRKRHSVPLVHKLSYSCSGGSLCAGIQASLFQTSLFQAEM